MLIRFIVRVCLLLLFIPTNISWVYISAVYEYFWILFFAHYFLRQQGPFWLKLGPVGSLVWGDHEQKLKSTLCLSPLNTDTLIFFLYADSPMNPLDKSLSLCEASIVATTFAKLGRQTFLTHLVFTEGPALGKPCLFLSKKFPNIKLSIMRLTPLVKITSACHN